MASTQAAPSDTQPSASSSTGGLDTATSFLGVLVPSQATDVAAEIAGRLEEVAAQVGDKVVADQILARLDPRAPQESLAMAEFSLRAERAELERRQLELDEAEMRYWRRRQSPEIFSREELDETALRRRMARASLKASEAQVSGQQARVRQLKEELDRTKLRAPFSGTVARRYLDPGATVTPGSPVVRLIGDDDTMVRFAVPQGEVDVVAIGALVDVRLDTGRTMRGVVQQVAPELDAPSQMVFVEARLEFHDQDIRDTEFAAWLRSGRPVRVVPQSR